MFGRNKLSDGEEQECQEEEEENANNGPVCPQSSEKEEQRQETPKNEINSQGEGKCSGVPGISTLDIEGWDQEHSKAEPEGAVTAVYGCAKRIANTEFHDASNELCEATHKDGKPEHCLVGPNSALWIGIW